MKQRSSELELMDLGMAYYESAQYEQCLKTLDAINTYLGGDRASFLLCKKLLFEPGSILDVGCGSGSSALKFALRYPNARVVGLDVDPHAIAHANKNLEALRVKSGKALDNVSFVVHDPAKGLSHMSKSFDVVMLSLVAHHIKTSELVVFLRELSQVARRAIIINDLHRSRIAYGLFWLISRFFKSEIAAYDGLISIKRGFKKSELEGIFRDASFSQDQYTIRWFWAFRWGITINIVQQ
jgi:SAM-dependent methyltransferase